MNGDKPSAMQTAVGAFAFGVVMLLLAVGSYIGGMQHDAMWILRISAVFFLMSVLIVTWRAGERVLLFILRVVFTVVVFTLRVIARCFGGSEEQYKE